MSEHNRNSTSEDRMLDEYLKGGSDLSRRYRESAAESVPPGLDERVLWMAREAASKRTKSRAWLRWTAPLAAAASAVVVLSIVMDQGAREQAAVTAVESQPAAVNKTVESQSAAPAELRNDVPPQSPQVAPPPQPDAEAFYAPQPAAPPPREAPLQEERRQVRQQAQQARQEKVGEAIREESSSEQVVVTGSRAREGAGALPVAPQTAAVQRVDARQIFVPPPVAAIDSAESSTEPADLAPAVPEDWLQAIRELREQGKTEQADREWKRFREAWPNYSVPETDRARPSP